MDCWACQNTEGTKQRARFLCVQEKEGKMNPKLPVVQVLAIFSNVLMSEVKQWAGKKSLD